MAFWRRRMPSYSSIDTKKDNKTIYSLAIIATKYDVDARALVESILKAWNKIETKGAKVNVQCRERSDEGGIFLFMKKRKAIAQFPISKRLLRRPEELVEFIEYEVA